MKPLHRLRFLHSAWRYRVHTERLGLAFLRSRELDGTTILDIGANRGIYSYWMHARVGRTGRVIAFEPQPELCESLAALRTAFGLSRLEIAGVGLSSKCGEMTLKRVKSHWGGASFDLHREDRDDVESFSVEVTTLDDFFQRRPPASPIRFVKCDIEGHELPALQGAARTLAEHRPDLLIECHDAANPRCAVFAYLASLDYAGFCFVRGGFAPVADYARVRNSIPRKALADFVFVPSERASELVGRSRSLRPTVAAATPEASVARIAS